jgi:hypothetical protein
MYDASLGSKVGTLDKAYRCMELAASSGGSSPLKLALAYAAIAQAEAAQRQADALEEIASALYSQSGVGSSVGLADVTRVMLESMNREQEN